MSLLGKSINEVILAIYQSIKSKREVIAGIQEEYLALGKKDNSGGGGSGIVSISRFKLIDLLDEFEITISQSLQGIQTLQTEICNLQEAQREKEAMMMMMSPKKDLSTILPMNNDDLFETIQGNNNPNDSVSVSVSNITSISQVYHKPKPKIGSNHAKLQFDYSGMKDKYEEQCKIGKKDDLLSGGNDSDMLSVVNNNHYHNNNGEQKENQSTMIQMPNLYVSYSETESEPIEQDKTRVPIRQCIKSSLGKNGSGNNSFCSYEKNKEKEKIIDGDVKKNNNNNGNNSKTIDDISSKREEIMNRLNQIEQEKKIQTALRKINNNATYKAYFAEKYGNGHYEEFIKKINQHTISLDEFQKELDILDYLSKSSPNTTSPPSNPNTTTKDTNIHHHHHNNLTTLNNTNNTINTSSSNIKKELIPKSKRTYSVNKTDGNLTITTNHKSHKPNPYIEPIKFGSNYLRGSDLRSSSKKDITNSTPTASSRRNLKS